MGRAHVRVKACQFSPRHTAITPKSWWRTHRALNHIWFSFPSPAVLCSLSKPLQAVIFKGTWSFPLLFTHSNLLPQLPGLLKLPWPWRWSSDSCKLLPANVFHLKKDWCFHMPSASQITICRLSAVLLLQEALLYAVQKLSGMTSTFFEHSWCFLPAGRSWLLQTPQRKRGNKRWATFVKCGSHQESLKICLHVKWQAYYWTENGGRDCDTQKYHQRIGAWLNIATLRQSVAL